MTLSPGRDPPVAFAFPRITSACGGAASEQRQQEIGEEQSGNGEVFHFKKGPVELCTFPILDRTWELAYEERAR